MAKGRSGAHPVNVSKMAAINYADLFDFPGYNKSIKDLQVANEAFGKTITVINDRIGAQYKEIRAELNDYLGVLKSFNVNQKNAGDTIIKTGESAISAAKKLAEQKRIMSELSSTTDLTTRSVNELKAASKALEQSYSSLSGRSDDVKAKKQALAAEARRVKTAIKEETDALRAASKVLDAAETSYQSYQNELNAISKQLKSMPGAFDAVTGKINQSNKAAVDLSKRYAEINNVLKIADAQLGNYQRNVGNYASATFSLTQVLRELPSLGISAQQFFLAISNNLPILFDQFGQLSKQIDSVTGKAIGSGGALKIFAQSIFSLGNLLTIGVTLLSVYGKEVGNFISGLFSSSKAVDQLKHSEELLNDVRKSTIKNAADEISKLDVLYKVATNTTLSLTERKKAVDQLQEQYPDYFKNISDEIILQGKAATAYDATKQAILEAAKTRAIENKLAELANQDLDLIQKKEALINKQRQNELDKRKADASTADKEDRGLQQFNAISEGTRLVASLADINKDLGQIAKDREFLLNQVTSAGTTKPEGKDASSSAKTKNVEDLIKKQQELLKSASDQAIAIAELQHQQGLIDETDFQTAKLGIIKSYVDAADELERSRKGGGDKKTLNDLNKEKIDAETEYQKFVNKSEAERLEDRKKAIEEEAQVQISALKDEQVETIAAKRLTDVQREALEIDYQNKIDNILINSLNERIKLETDAAKKSALERERDALQRGIKSRGGAFDESTLKKEYQSRVDAENKAFALIAAGRDVSFKDQQDHLERLAKIEQDYADKGVDITKDAEERKYQEKVLAAEREKALRQELEETLQQGIQAGLDIAQNLVDGKFEERIANLETEKEKELTLAGSNAAARELIEEKYQKKISEQKNKQARADKAFALFGVAINTAQAISKTIAQFGMPFAIPFIALAAVQGAIQAAVIASRPLPKYKKGRSGGPAEYAIVDEEGPELIINSRGQLQEIGGDQGPRTTYLEQGSKVIPAAKTKEILKDMEIQNVVRQIKLTGQLSSSIQKGRQDEMVHVMTKAMQGGHLNQKAIEQAFRDAIRHIPIQQWIHDERGVRLREKTINNTTTYLNNLTKLG